MLLSFRDRGNGCFQVSTLVFSNDLISQKKLYLNEVVRFLTGHPVYITVGTIGFQGYLGGSQDSLVNDWRVCTLFGSCCTLFVLYVLFLGT
jgi:hypothetical protein